MYFIVQNSRSLKEAFDSLLPAQEPIQRAFLLFSLRPETFSKLSKVLRASESDFSEPQVVLSAYWLHLISNLLCLFFLDCFG